MSDFGFSNLSDNVEGKPRVLETLLSTSGPGGGSSESASGTYQPAKGAFWFVERFSNLKARACANKLQEHVHEFGRPDTYRPKWDQLCTDSDRMPPKRRTQPQDTAVRVEALYIRVRKSQQERK